jgi:hypothetical protein
VRIEHIHCRMYVGIDSLLKSLRENARIIGASGGEKKSTNFACTVDSKKLPAKHRKRFTEEHHAFYAVVGIVPASCLLI